MTREYRFVCPDCEECVIVDRQVREEIIEEGCVVCRTRISPDCFEVV